MARLRCGITTEGSISIVAGATKTLLQLLAPANQRLAAMSAYISFEGVTSSDKPCEVTLLRQTTAGTMSAATEFSTRDDPETPQAVGLFNATVEPSAGQILKRWFVHPQAGYERIWLPGADEYEVKGGGRLGLRVISPASGWTTVNVQAGLEWEE